MEAIEELAVPSIAESVKVIDVVIDESEPVTVEVDVCYKSNGVTEFCDSGSVVSQSDAQEQDSVGAIQQHIMESAVTETSEADSATAPAPAPAAVGSLVTDVGLLAAISETASAVQHLLNNSEPSETLQEITEEIIENHEEVVTHDSEMTLEESTVEIDHVGANDTVMFKTEILIEKNINDMSLDPNAPNQAVANEHSNTNNLLNDLDQGLELSEVLRSSDTADNVENNNCTARQEVFNKEELLDILEGNDMSSSGNQATEIIDAAHPDSKKILEAEIAMKQLTKLKCTRKSKNKRIKTISAETTPKKKREGSIKKLLDNNTENINSTKENSINNEENSQKQEENAKTNEGNGKDKNESIVDKLVEDWNDDEPSDMDQPEVDDSNLDKACEELTKSLEAVTSQEEVVTKTSTASPPQKEQTVKVKSEDESQPQRRLGRVIKKKVIFDPDNPDTFTKGKAVTKIKEPHPEQTKEQPTPSKDHPPPSKDHPPPKKLKTDEPTQKVKSKSPVSKMQWKKPQPKNSSKQNKRLTEVDKLLMDEGAVNMIYQLTPEAPKGRKNMRTKAEFIKKIQSSTPDGKEMKFRERKKEAKCEEGEAKKIVGGKQRSSLSSSVKSPAPVEDFENISADDSIIYRRHSSSSYSSTCMSPRRLSDVEAGAVHSVAKASQQAANSLDTTLEANSADQSTDVFMADVSNASVTEIINKDDCLSIKEKLNSKLSQALKKRKRDSSKTEKTPKQKKVPKAGEKSSSKTEHVRTFKHLSISFDQRLAEICIMKTCFNVEIVKELEQALEYVDTKKDVSVTLLTSESGMLCSDLDLSLVLDASMELRTNNAYELAESVRSLLSTVEGHSKLLVCGVWGTCADLALALVALSDVALASERATFALRAAPPRPCVAVLTSRSQLSQSLVNDMAVLARQLSATEALQSGLVSRVLWPERVEGQVLAIARDIAAQPTQSILLKKNLLSLKRRSESVTFLSGLEKERDLLVEYWTSVEGQEVLRATLND